MEDKFEEDKKDEGLSDFFSLLYASLLTSVFLAIMPLDHDGEKKLILDDVSSV